MRLGLSVTRTIRLEKELDELIQKMADGQRVTVNSIVNRSLRKLVDWDVYTEKFGMVAMTPWLSIQLMERQSLDEARELGRKVARQSARQAIESIFIDFNLGTTLGFLSLFGKYGARFDFEDSVDGRKHVILIRHGQGLKWSTYYEGILRGLLEDELGLKIDVRVSADSCLARFEA